MISDQKGFEDIYDLFHARQISYIHYTTMADKGVPFKNDHKTVNFKLLYHHSFNCCFWDNLFICRRGLVATMFVLHATGHRSESSLVQSHFALFFN